ncbi:hypothetical protein MLP_29140 [Microlunatus phosphovorus NM-1]|uniref:Uncharacterized protein n=1 Tax=Microlunatus phosphovorus (strain ATCC 700054 / DSM 10555 / JCM 9379 / NBRC 101784 / NCIMB 13414 / VKM Ac-1990 / NM-1) TaxID=1032480 RepID=F5XJM8_MICPN|nr:hypothetical protein [Microlunatus phosphovorus]BAK35928.1 hypothetical protein MLP_29140 [Microlunatus phosphovorus NM-1]
MRATTKPLPGFVLSVVLVFMGWYMVTNSTSGMASSFGWFFMVIGLLAGVGNLFLVVVSKRAERNDRR